MTITEILNKVAIWISSNGNFDISGSQLREIFQDILGQFTTNIPVIGPVTVITYTPYSIATLSNGSLINGTTVAMNNTVVLMGQTTASENGYYVIGQNAGETLRHDDYPNAASCADKIIISTNPDENGNNVISSVLNGEVLIPIIPGIVPNTMAEGKIIFNTIMGPIEFEKELSSVPTRIKLWFWDLQGMPVSGGYDAASVSTTGMQVKVPGNEGENILCIYEVKI